MSGTKEFSAKLSVGSDLKGCSVSKKARGIPTSAASSGMTYDLFRATLSWRIVPTSTRSTRTSGLVRLQQSISPCAPQAQKHCLQTQRAGIRQYLSSRCSRMTVKTTKKAWTKYTFTMKNLRQTSLFNIPLLPKVNRGSTFSLRRPHSRIVPR